MFLTPLLPLHIFWLVNSYWLNGVNENSVEFHGTYQETENTPQETKNNINSKIKL